MPSADSKGSYVDCAPDPVSVAPDAAEEGEVVHDVVEKTSYINVDYDSKTKVVAEYSDTKKIYDLTDGNITTVNSERSSCPEVSSQPSFIGKDACDVNDTSFQSIMKFDVDFRVVLYAFVMLSGA